MFKKNPLKKAVPARPTNNANTSTIANKRSANPQSANAGTKKKKLPPNYLDPNLF